MEDTDETNAEVIGAIKSGSAAVGRGSNDEAAVVDGESPFLEYAMNHKSRGMCVLVNQKRFNPRTGLDTRDGTDLDAERVKKTFRELGFEVRSHSDLRAQEILNVVHEASRVDHSGNDCFAFVMLSHGFDGKIFGTDSTVDVEHLTRPFRGNLCSSLLGKPKLFFFQAFPGYRMDVTDAMTASPSGDLVSTKIPIEADFLLAYSAVPDYFFIGDRRVEDSKFVQSLCNVLTEHAPQGMEMMHMMVLVNHLVASSYDSCTDAELSDRMKRMPSIDCRLMKLLYFNRKAK